MASNNYCAGIFGIKEILCPFYIPPIPRINHNIISLIDEQRHSYFGAGFDGGLFGAALGSITFDTRLGGSNLIGDFDWQINANRLIKECMTGIAMRKKGLTEKHYLSPLSKRHAR